VSAPRLCYRDAGVDLDAADAFTARVRELARASHTPGVVPFADAYAGLFRPALDGLRAPLLAASCDGVGTKLLVARACGRHRGLGQDLVAMNVNDLLPAGARPLFFLDYLAAGRLDPEPLVEVVAGIAEACAEVGCALLGGETAELPGLYREGDFDLAGFAVGLVDAEQVPRGPVEAGDVVLGLPSSGLHSNGLSLARRALEQAGIGYGDVLPELGASVGEVLLTPTRLYVRPVLSVLADLAPARIKAAAHITGGGLLGRSRKLVPPGLRIEIDPGSYRRPSIFDVIARAGGISEIERARSFKMGLGFLLIVRAEDAARILSSPNSPISEVGRITHATADPGRSALCGEVDLGYATA
jgi:phosphoribosylformylglycinamidine cyclo-ligase